MRAAAGCELIEKEQRFVSRCSICDNLMKDPASCMLCMTSSCATCSINCRICDGLLKQNDVLKVKTAQLNVKCCLCTKEMTFGEWHNHTCRYMCPNGCQEEITSVTATQHKASCPKEKINCPGCSETGERIFIEGDHLGNCCPALQLKLKHEEAVNAQLAESLSKVIVAKHTLQNFPQKEKINPPSVEPCTGKEKGCEFVGDEEIKNIHEEQCIAAWKAKNEAGERKCQTLVTEFATAMQAKEAISKRFEASSANYQKQVNTLTTARQIGISSIRTIDMAKTLCRSVNDNYQFACNGYYDNVCCNPNALKEFTNAGVGLHNTADCWMTFTFPAPTDIKYIVLGDPAGTSGGWSTNYLVGSKLLLDGAVQFEICFAEMTTLVPIMKQVKEIKLQKNGYFAVGFFKAVV